MDPALPSWGRLPAAALLVLLLSATGAVGQVERQVPIVVGTVVDALGSSLAGVEIVLAAGEETLPIVVVRSDVLGRFRLASLEPGVYRLAALKKGYATFVGSVDTLIERSISIVLSPTATADPRRIAEDPVWALRLPRRGVLRELRPEAEPEPARFASTEVGLAPRMEVEQLFALGSEPEDGGQGSRRIGPTETRFRLASGIGERGSLRLRTAHEAFEPGASAQAARRATASVGMDFSYETGPDAQLDMTAFFGRADLRLDGDAAASSAAPIAEEQLAWSCDARWSKQLAPERSLSVAVDYRDLSLGSSALVHPGPEMPIVPSADLGNRAVGAEGTFAGTKNDRHAFEFAMRAQLRTTPFALGSAGAVPLGADPTAGWSFEAEARNRYAVSAPFALVYGLGYKHSAIDDGAKLLVPRLGGSWSRDGFRVSGLLAYHAVADKGPSGSSRFRPAESLGFEAEMELPIVDGLVLSGGSAYSPIQFEQVGYAPGIDLPGGQPLYYTDGNTAVRTHRMGLVAQGGSTQSYVELSHGRASGLLVANLPFEIASGLADRKLVFDSGRVGLRFPDYGTDLHLAYQRVASGDRAMPDDTTAMRESVEVRVGQQLTGLQSSAAWHLLLAVRLGSAESLRLAGLDRDADQAMDELERALRAGVSVVF